MDSFYNITLLSVGLAVAAVGVLGFVIFFNNTKSITNRTFLFLSLVTIIWGVSNYANSTFRSENIDLILLVLRAHLFVSLWYALSLFQLFYVFPSGKVKFPAWYKFFLVPLVIVVAILTLSPLVFTQITELPPIGQVPNPERGPGIILFAALAAFLAGGGIYFLFRKMLKATGTEKTQFKYIFLGVFITFPLMIVFNMILPVFFNQLQFIPLGAIATLPFVAFTAYAIMRHGLLNVKVVATEILVFVLAVAVLLETIFARGAEILLDASIFILVLAFGILLIRSVRKEIEQREKLEILSKELGAANERLKELDDLKTDFISIASHQLRTPLTAIKGYTSMTLEGSYGEITLKVRGVLDKVFQSANRLIYIVNDLLDISRIEQGRFQLAFEDVKVANVLRDIVEELKPNAEKRNIAVSFSVSPDDADVTASADFNKIRQVFTNIIDNAIKYTPQGSVAVSVERRTNGVVVAVKDTGLGIAPVTLQNLFQKFTRAKGVTKLHTDGSGLGLYVAKEIMKAHHGAVWAESEGEGKGSQFYIQLPFKQPENATPVSLAA